MLEDKYDLTVKRSNLLRKIYEYKICSVSTSAIFSGDIENVYSPGLFVFTILHTFYSRKRMPDEYFYNIEKHAVLGTWKCSAFNRLR